VSLFNFAVSVVVYGPLILIGLSVILLWRFRHRRVRVAVALVLLALIAAGLFEEWSSDLGYPRPYAGPDTVLRHVTTVLSDLLFALIAAYAVVIGLLVFGGDGGGAADPASAEPARKAGLADRAVMAGVGLVVILMAVFAIGLSGLRFN